jgi:tetratricopeptide (TPR) repeat protein
MTYPGNRELSAQAQERVLTAFRQAVRKLQEGGREEAIIALEFVLRLDPAFEPARNLQRQLESGSSEIDLSGIISQLQAPGTEETDHLLVSAVEDFNERRFLEAKGKVEKVLIDLPGHPEARQLSKEIDTALKSESQVAQYLTQAREALDGGDGEEAANFVMMAQAVDPHHPGISAALAEIREAGVGSPAIGAFEPTKGGAAPPPVSFDATDGSTAPSFDTGPDPYASAREQSAGFGPAEGGGGAPEFDFAAPDSGIGGVAQGADQPNIADLFGKEEAEQQATPDVQPAAAGDDEDERNIERLLKSGQDAFDTGDYHQAIDTWSRIFLIDPAHSQAREAIEQARQRDEEVGERVDHLMKEAEEARDGGRLDLARRHVHDVLSLRPDHIEAFDLKEQLDAGKTKPPAGAPPVPPPSPAAGDVSLDGLDVDMFDETAPEPETPRGDLFTDADYTTPVEPEMPSVGHRRLPMLQIAFGALALLVVGLGIWFGSRMLSGRREAASHQVLERTMTRAEELFKGGHPQEAIQLLQGYPASDLDRARIEQRLARYRRALVPPTPTPIPEQATAAQAAYDDGRWLEAYELVEAGIEAHPHDGGLVELRERIASQEKRIPALVRARQKRDYETASNLARELLNTYPNQKGLRHELERDLFDLAVSELRGYNLTGAEGHLNDLLQLDPGDSEATRILEFVSSYKTRPADMQLRIFIASLKDR